MYPGNFQFCKILLHLGEDWVAAIFFCVPQNPFNWRNGLGDSMADPENRYCVHRHDSSFHHDSPGIWRADTLDKCFTGGQQPGQEGSRTVQVTDRVNKTNISTGKDETIF